MTSRQIIQTLTRQADKSRALKSARFFKTGPGDYAADDKFLGITVPVLRSMVKQSGGTLTLADAITLLQNEWHEIRLFALFAMVDLFNRADQPDKKKIVSAYFSQKKFINNWDLVDSSAYFIAGAWYFDKNRSRLDKLINARRLWDRRIAMIATLHYIRHNDLDDTFKYAAALLNDKEDLMHKASGWMLREAGKRDPVRLYRFLDQHLQQMPRTMLRYAIEKLPQDRRKHYMLHSK